MYFGGLLYPCIMLDANYMALQGIETSYLA